MIQQRLDEINKEVKRFCNVPFNDLSDKRIKHINRLADEQADLEDQLALHKKAQGMMSMASPEEHGFAGRNPGDSGYPLTLHASKSVIDDPMEQKAAEHGLAARKHVGPSMWQMSDKQLRDIYAAGRSNMSFGTTIGKGAEGNMGLIDETVSEGSVGSLLPPILLPTHSRCVWSPRGSLSTSLRCAQGQAISFCSTQGRPWLLAVRASPWLRTPPSRRWA
jgi:hypothetical protein